jgi:hypothetical protein
VPPVDVPPVDVPPVDVPPVDVPPLGIAGEPPAIAGEPPRGIACVPPVAMGGMSLGRPGGWLGSACDSSPVSSVERAPQPPVSET